MTSFVSCKLPLFLFLIFHYSVFGKICEKSKLPQRLPRPKRIVSGVKLAEESYPFFVYVDKDNFFCGGTLISENAVLTAAHCVYYQQKDRWAKYSEISVYDGNFLEPHWMNKGNYAKAKISHYKAHPFYNPHLNRGSGVYDIAVITLQKPLSETSGREKSPLLPCPPPNFQPSMYKNATLVGLGLDKRKTKERIQQITEAKLERDDKCGKLSQRGVSPTWNLDGYSHVCYSLPCEYSQGTCFGNTGSPLVYKKPDAIGVECLLGVMRFGAEFCNNMDYPSVFTHVGALSAWIANQI